jgi:hypothetical protein
MCSCWNKEVEIEQPEIIVIRRTKEEKRAAVSNMKEQETVGDMLAR